MDNEGYVFLVLIKGKSLSTPGSYQVWKGLNSENINENLFKSFVNIAVSNKDFSIKIDNLIENTDYEAFFVGGSGHPGFPDLMADNNVKKLTVKTKKIPIKGLFFYFF